MTLPPNQPNSSWVQVRDDSDFSLDNIPFGICSFPSLGSSRPRCCSAIGDVVIDLSLLAEAGLFQDIQDLNSPTYVFSQPTLNVFMEHPKPVWKQVRQRLQTLLLEESTSSADLKKDDRLYQNSALQAASLIPLSQTIMHLPASIGDYTDFYSSKEHATNVGTMFRGADNALQPNWLHLPVGYHGRSSSVYASGTGVVRPCGQLQKNAQDPKEGSVFGPCKLLDFELEMGFFVGGTVNDGGQRLSMEEAQDRIFGFVLMNDWSARDIQKWEYVPLGERTKVFTCSAISCNLLQLTSTGSLLFSSLIGPFGSKNFATTISPWVITTMALEDYSCPTSVIEQTNPTPLPYLQDPSYDSYDIALTVSIQGENMTEAKPISLSNYTNMYWNARQQLVHHSVTGCPMRAGDLLGSGTISGEDASTFGSMLELSWKGTREVQLGDSGEFRKFLKDGDVVIIEGIAGKGTIGGGTKGRVGFGSCTGKVCPALDSDTLNHQKVVENIGTRYTNFKLHGHWRSSSTWRVRVALAAKSISFESIDVDLLNGETKTTRFAEQVNAMKQIPVLQFDDAEQHKTIQISQSLAIIDFLEDAFPRIGASLLPTDIVDKALCREIAEIVNSGIQPHQNLSTIDAVNGYANSKEGSGDKPGKELARNHIKVGLEAVHNLLRTRRKEKGQKLGLYGTGTFSPTIADACIVPQLYNARRFGIDLEELYPLLVKVEASCLVHPWFIESHPDTVKKYC